MEKGVGGVNAVFFRKREETNRVANPPVGQAEVAIERISLKDRLDGIYSNGHQPGIHCEFSPFYQTEDVGEVTLQDGVC